METTFSQLTAERKLEIKRLGSYQTKYCPLVQVYGKNTPHISHLSEKIKTHGISDVHLHSAVKYKMFGSTTNIISQVNDEKITIMRKSLEIDMS